jgi:plastocyanin
VKNRLAPILACFVLGLAVLGCGDDEDGAGDDVSAPKPAQTTGDKSGGSGGAKAEKSVAVKVVDIDYEPREVTVAKGGTITWTHTGNLPHTVTKDDGPGPDFSSETLSNGDTFKQTFDVAGTIEYVCKIHPQQRGTITVAAQTP